MRRFLILISLIPITATVIAQVPVFTEVTEEAGLDMLHGELPPGLPLNGSTPDFYGASVAVVDYNSDGWPDLYLTRHQSADRLYRNNGDGTFTDVLADSGLGLARNANGMAWADFDNDGDQDVFLNSLLENRHYFFLNNGDGTFTEAASERGAALEVEGLHHGMSATFADVDRDGWLDIFATAWGVDLSTTDPEHHNFLLLNRGSAAPAHFRNTTRSAGLVIEGTSLPGEQHGFSAYLSDFDSDGWPDLGYIADFGNSEFFWGRGNGRFTESTAQARVGTDQNGMGGAVGDIDNDGDLDWFVTSIDGTFSEGLDGNRMYRNEGGRRFADVTDAAGVRNGGWAWGAAFADFDQDGDLDLVQTNGFMPGEPSGPEDPFTDRTLLWINDGTGTFTEIGEQAGIDDLARGQGVAVLDYDRDGDLDFIITNTYYRPVLYRNDTAPGNDWLQLRLEGTVSNRDGIGARVELQAEPDGPTRIRELSPGNAYLSQHQKLVHFGLGQGIGSIYRLVVRWPSGSETELHDIGPNQVLHIIEPDDTILSAPRIIRAPEGLSAYRDEPVTLSVEASANPQPAYQWFRNGTAIEGETGAVLRLERMRPFHEADYTVEVSNALGTVSPEPVRLEYLHPQSNHSIARQWNDLLLDAIRVDYPDPTVHSRNLFHTAIAMWDVYVAYEDSGQLVPYLHKESLSATNPEAARAEAISYAVYRILSSRYQLSPNADYSQADFDALMEHLGLDPDNTTMIGESPAALGNRVAARVLAYGWRDGANEAGAYADQTGYSSVNEPMIFDLPGVEVVDPNRWQPLAFDFLVLQNGLPVGAAIQGFLGLNWRQVEPFALNIPQDGSPPLDPGPPPLLGTASDTAFKEGALSVIRASSVLDPRLDELIDISPGAYYNNPLGTNDGEGYPLNPVTGEPYAPNPVRYGDYSRVIAEFWADGPDSETPPGHWNTIAHHVTESFEEKRLYGDGPELDDLGWDVRLYFALNGALHDAAIAAWASKRYYDYVRPVTLIRYMAQMGQSSDPEGPSYHPDGLPLEPGLVEMITEESSAVGERHEHLADFIGEVALYCWIGEPEDPARELGGVDWMRAVTWMPYQRFSFVTPPFAAYVSGHSTFSRAAAEVLARFTGSEYFPGGLYTYTFPENEFLHFEEGPSETITLTWARYQDAADEAGLSRIYGGIHVPADDFKGRIMGSEAGINAWEKARTYFDGTARTLDWSVPGDELEQLVRSLDAANLLRAGGDSGAAGLQMQLPSGVDQTRMQLQYSNDLQEWRFVPFEEAAQSVHFLDHGEASIQLVSPDSGARFFRLVYE